MADLTPRTGHIEWVARQIGRELTAPEQELVTILTAGLGLGPWNIHRDWRIMRGDHHGASMHVRAELSTYDFDALSRLVFAAHDRCCRLTVSPSGPRGLRVEVWPRPSRDGEMWQRHPTLEAAVSGWRKEQDNG